MSRPLNFSEIKWGKFGKGFGSISDQFDPSLAAINPDSPNTTTAYVTPSDMISETITNISNGTSINNSNPNKTSTIPGWLVPVGIFGLILLISKRR